MREFTKSVISYGWALTVFQVQQLANAMMTNPETGHNAATAGYNELVRATAQQLTPTMQATFRAGDAVQRAMVNMMFGAVANWDSAGCHESRQLRGAQTAGMPAPRGGTANAQERHSPRPTWREPGRPEYATRRPSPAPYAAANASVPATPIDTGETRSAVQGWGPMP